MTLSVIVWFFPVSFSATGQDLWSIAALWLTHSGGKYGTFLIIILTSYCYTIRVEVIREKWRTFIKSLVALTLFTAGLAFINEHVTKRMLKEARPSHRYMLMRSQKLDKLDSLYSLQTDLRAAYFEKLVKENTATFQNISSDILDHWIEEAGYSFPSGHSFNAFLLATVIAFSLSHSSSKKLNKLYALPFVWAFFVAVSRVALGAHTPMDVTAGATMGFIIASLFLYFDRTKRLIIHKRHTA